MKRRSLGLGGEWLSLSWMSVAINSNGNHGECCMMSKSKELSLA